MYKEKIFIWGASLSLVLVSFFVVSPVQAKVFYVNSSGDKSDQSDLDQKCSTGDMIVVSGVEQEECSLRAAIEESNVNGESDIIYFLHQIKNILVNERLKIEPDNFPGQNSTIIRGNIAIDAKYQDKVFQIAEGANVVMSHIGITGGMVKTGSNLEGAGITNHGNLDLFDVSIFGNIVKHDDQIDGSYIRGAGIFNSSKGKLSIFRSNIGPRNILKGSGFDAEAHGAGIFNAGELEIKKTNIFNNYVFAKSTGEVGFAKSRGGGIYNVTFERVDIDNSAIYNNRVYATISEIGLNARAQGAGIYGKAWTEMHITNTTISGNQTFVKAGGPNSFGFAHGGAVYLAAHTKTYFANSTIANNKLNMSSYNSGNVSGVGSAVFAVYTGLSDVRLKNTILDNPGENCNYKLATDGYNISSDYTCKLSGLGDKQGLSSKLADLKNNGGFTKTQALKQDSPAINAGNPNGCYDFEGSQIKRDQRGKIRPLNSCDVGAYEK